MFGLALNEHLQCVCGWPMRPADGMPKVEAVRREGLGGSPVPTHLAGVLGAPAHAREFSLDGWDE